MAGYQMEVATTRWWWVLNAAGERVERHASEAAAVAATKRLNGICLHCDRPLAECRIENPRDESFGAEYHEDEED